MCPRCRSRERHRVLWLFVARETTLLTQPQALLHFAPEQAVGGRLQEIATLNYLSGDLDPLHAMEEMDMTAIPKPDESFDVVLVSHVLEHIPDDRAAMAELFRVLKPGGTALLQHPVDDTLPETYEDWSITTPEEKRRAFLQDDHVRIYGLDLKDRLESFGFSVEVRRYRDELASEDRERFRLDQGTEDKRSDDIYVCTKPRAVSKVS